MDSNTKISFSDMIKNSFLENFQSDISLLQMVITLALAFAIGVFIYVLYKRIFSGVLYSKSFNISLVGLSLITSLMIMAINSNLILSLGMVGALSIVRFRTPIKDPTDLIFLFWSVAVGIVTGAGFYTLAILSSIVIGLVLFIFMKKASFETPYLLVVHCEGDQAEKELYENINNMVKRHSVKQKTVTHDDIEITLELRLTNNEPRFVNHISEIAGVKNAVLISYNGDYVS
ncbi:DUF4956 domain-containing protein [Bacillus chungangensis]|uniref:Membrane protein YhiD involved in acid resistance n=1 Tax=Bacillus chungangensis TaxID=587633 RepID=A0ABT9WS08_9BACI|nr:DUF4956 domain-containing protein [Bacillus chungangensis]MDQ0175515.1 putative membrane protein YhiD involved in acid resistance [Bacillus chungangensis]